MAQDLDALAGKKCLPMRAHIRDNPDGVYLCAFGITPDQRQAAVEEATILKPYRLYAFEHTAKLLSSLGINWHISDGSLLGWYRNGHTIPHDIDFDTSILEEDALKVWQNRHLLPQDLEMVFDDPASPGFNWCTEDECFPYNPNKGGVKRMMVEHKGVPPEEQGHGFYWAATVDIYTWRLEEDGYHCNYMFNDYPAGLKAFPRSLVFPLQKAKFEGVDVFVPNKPKEWLEIGYGYLGEDAVWDETTKLYKPRQLGIKD